MLSRLAIVCDVPAPTKGTVNNNLVSTTVPVGDDVVFECLVGDALAILVGIARSQRTPRMYAQFFVMACSFGFRRVAPRLLCSSVFEPLICFILSSFGAKWCYVLAYYIYEGDK